MQNNCNAKNTAMQKNAMQNTRQCKKEYALQKQLQRKKELQPGGLHFWGSDPTLTHPKPPQSTSRET